ncbi:MAG: hypothetical protein AAGD07_22930, partial [Planctomycetota bacterium]
ESGQPPLPGLGGPRGGLGPAAGERGRFQPNRNPPRAGDRAIGENADSPRPPRPGAGRPFPPENGFPREGGPFNDQRQRPGGARPREPRSSPPGDG